jgi:hypothetical protein
VEASAAVAQKMEEWLALHAATVSKKACSVLHAGELRPPDSGWGQETVDW